MLASAGLVERGETETDAYMRIVTERYLLLRTHDWSGEVLERMRSAERRAGRGRREPPGRPPAPPHRGGASRPPCPGAPPAYSPARLPTPSPPPPVAVPAAVPVPVP